MKKRLQRLIFILGSILILGTAAHAGSGEIALGAKAGTLGLGAVMTIGILPHFNARLGVNGFTYSYDEMVSDIDYDFDLNLFSGTLLADWHFQGGAFRLTAGLVFNQNEVDFDAKTDNDYFIIDDVAYAQDDVGDLKGTVGFNTLSPYLGIGWGDAVGEDKRFSFFIDLGVLFQGSPQVDMKATGSISSDPQFQRHLENEEKEIEDETENYTVYPVVAIGIAYKF